MASELISPRIQINSGRKVDEAARDVTAHIAWAYRLSRSKITLSDLVEDLPGLESLLKHMQRFNLLSSSVCNATVSV
jgi:hypothetical protein